MMTVSQLDELASIMEYYERLGFSFRRVATDGDFTGARDELDLTAPKR